MPLHSHLPPQLTIAVAATALLSAGEQQYWQLVCHPSSMFNPQRPSNYDSCLVKSDYMEDLVGLLFHQ